MWAFKFLVVLKAFPQFVQTKGFSPEWVLLWSTRVQFSVKDLLQMSQENGRSPVWVSMCVFKCDFWENGLSHWSHLYGFVCLRKCMVKEHLEAKVFLQNSQLNICSVECVFICARRLEA